MSGCYCIDCGNRDPRNKSEDDNMVSEEGNMVFEEGNMVFEEDNMAFEEGNMVFEEDNMVFEDDSFYFSLVFITPPSSFTPSVILGLHYPVILGLVPRI